MKLTWLGHSGFRLETAEAVILIDPWLDGCPTFPTERRAEAIEGATHILLTHAHFDHADEVAAIAKDTGATVVGIFDLTTWLEAAHGLTCVGFNKGGTVALGDAQVTMVNATHSSTRMEDGKPIDCGDPAGYMIAVDGKVIYLSGDTDIMADMGWMADLHKPDIGILCAGGHFTMDMARAGYAAKTFFDFKTVIPCHYQTFPLLEQSADALIAALPGVDVKTPAVMEIVEL
ncbi:MAG: metal-dependent hydrolase [Rhodobacterales bacterium]|nr:MAG: metal-dependent hydrolase [Rhodobacterales bacterium]